MKSHTHHRLPDPGLLENRMASRTVLISFAVLLLTALLQSIVVYFTRSAGLLADTIHNYGDAFTGIPLWIAFLFSRRSPTRRFNYGFDRLEDMAGLFLAFIILGSGTVVFYESAQRFLHPQELSHHLWGVTAGVIGFIGNEMVAVYKIRMGKKIDSAALIADGKHVQADALTSLAAAAGILASWFGFQWLDPSLGVVISLFILVIAYQTGKEIIIRLLDGIAPHLYEEMEHICRHHAEVKDVYDIRARWFGRKILAELTLALDSHLDLQRAHEIAEEVKHQLLHEVKRLEDVTVHFDPADVAHAHELTAHHFK